MSFIQNLDLVPSDFVSIFIDKQPVHQKYPWRYIDNGRYELRQLLYYNDSTWRMFNICFSFEDGFTFSSQFLSGQGETRSDAQEITREEFDKLFSVKNGTTTHEGYRPNDVIMLNWLIARNVITSVSKDAFKAIKKALSDIWSEWGRTEYDIQDNEYLLANNHLYYEYMQPIAKNILLYPLEPDWEGEELVRTTGHYVPCVSSKTDWRCIKKSVLQSSSYIFELNERKMLCSVDFNFERAPYYKITHITYIDVPKWETFCINENHKNIILKKMLDDGVIRHAVSFSRRSWEQRSIEKAKIKILSSEYLQQITSNKDLSNSCIKRW